MATELALPYLIFSFVHDLGVDIEDRAALLADFGISSGHLSSIS